MAQERRISEGVFERLNLEFEGRIRLKPYYWEYEPVVITNDYQSQIPAPSQFDIVVCILWSRLGSQLHSQHTLPPDHKRVARSGTEFELVDAVEARKRNGATPDILIWLNQTEPLIPLGADDRDERIRQWETLNEFLREWTVDSEEKVFTGAVNAYDGLVEFEQRFEEKLRKLVEKRLAEGGESKRAASPAKRSAWVGESPFRGLTNFAFEHASFFFGRTQAIDGALRNLRSQIEKGQSFLAVVGASGSGKSSLAQAGIVPMLIRPNVIEGVGFWRRCVFKPSDGGNDPFRAIASALIEEEAVSELLIDGERRDPAIERIARELESNPDLLVQRIASCLELCAVEEKARQHQTLLEIAAGLEAKERTNEAVAVRKKMDSLEKPKFRLVMVVDQLEEIFSDAIDEEKTERFFECLRALSSGAPGYAVCVATIRSDFFPQCASYPVLLDLMQGNGSYTLAKPSDTEIGQMIREPARVGGIRFESNPETGESLDELIRDESIRQKNALPLMAHVLEQLHLKSKAREDDTLKFEDYHEMGGLEGALSRQGDAIYDSLSKEEKKAFSGIIPLLVSTTSRTSGIITKRVATQDEISQVEHGSECIAKFVDGRLITSDLDSNGAQTYSFSHDLLIEVWKRIETTLEPYLESLRLRSELEEDRKRWEIQGRDPGYLIAVGKPLDSSLNLAASDTFKLSDELRSYIAASEAHQLMRSRGLWKVLSLVVYGLMFATFLLLVVVSSLLGVGNEVLETFSIMGVLACCGIPLLLLAGITRSEVKLPKTTVVLSVFFLLLTVSIIVFSIILFRQSGANDWITGLLGMVLIFGPLLAWSIRSGLRLLKRTVLQRKANFKNMPFEFHSAQTSRYAWYSGTAFFAVVLVFAGIHANAPTADSWVARSIARISEQLNPYLIVEFPLESQEVGISALAYNSDGSMLAAGAGVGDGSIRLWDTSNWKLIDQWQHPAGRDKGSRGVKDIEFCPMQNAIAVSGQGEFEMRFLDGTELSQQQLDFFETIYAPSVLKFDNEGMTLAVVAGIGEGTQIYLIDTETWGLKAKLPQQTGIIHRLEFSQDDSLLASCSDDGFLKIWEVATGEELNSISNEYENYLSKPEAAYFNGASREELITIWDDGGAVLYNSAKNEMVWSYYGLESGVFVSAVSSDCMEFAVSKNIGYPELNVRFDVMTVSPNPKRRTYPGHRDFLTDLEISPSENVIATGCLNGTVRIWKLPEW